ncbi:hypothetical protein ACROSR_17375 [Roseovarius tibetensis]
MDVAVSAIMLEQNDKWVVSCRHMLVEKLTALCGYCGDRFEWPLRIKVTCVMWYLKLTPLRTRRGKFCGSICS